MDKILAREWHPTKNGKLRSSDFTSGSNQPVWWQCDNGHSWKTRVKVRTEGHGCPYCVGQKATKENSLAKKNPHLAKQWHPSKNGQVTPRTVSPGSGKRVWWKCDQGHEWQAVVNDRSYGRGCPDCVGTTGRVKPTLASFFPIIAREWNYDLNGELEPTEVAPRSTKDIWWMCASKHSWQSSVADRTIRKKSCPQCNS